MKNRVIRFQPEGTLQILDSLLVIPAAKAQLGQVVMKVRVSSMIAIDPRQEFLGLCLPTL